MKVFTTNPRKKTKSIEDSTITNVAININGKFYLLKIDSYFPDINDMHIIGQQIYYPEFNKIYHVYDYNLFSISSGTNFSSYDLKNIKSINTKKDFIIGSKGIYEHFCLKYNKHSQSYYNLKDFDKFQLKCYTPHTQYLNKSENLTSIKTNCKHFSSKKCYMCNRGFYKREVTTYAPLPTNIDLDLLSKMNKRPIAKKENKCVPCNVENCDLCYSQSGNCFSCKIGYYLPRNNGKYCLKVKRDEVYDPLSNECRNLEQSLPLKNSKKVKNLLLSDEFLTPKTHKRQQQLIINMEINFKEKGFH